MNNTVLLINEHVGMLEIQKMHLFDLGFQVIDVLSSGNLALDLVEEKKPFVVVVGEKTVDMTGIDVCLSIKKKYRNEVLTVIYGDDVYLKYFTYFSNFVVDAVLDSKYPPEFLAYQIKCVMAGLSIIPKDVHMNLLGQGGKIHGFSDPDLRVLYLMSQGLKNHEIASKLGISLKTVEHRLTTLYRQLGVKSRKAAIREFELLMDDTLTERISNLFREEQESRAKES